MKQFIILFLLGLLCSCLDSHDGLNSYPLQSKGEIAEIIKKDTNVYIRVEFLYLKDEVSSVWFIGSDTCSVGQKINLK